MSRASREEVAEQPCATQSRENMDRKPADETSIETVFVEDGDGYIRMAEELADAGIASVRFDLVGAGESTAEDADLGDDLGCALGRDGSNPGAA